MSNFRDTAAAAIKRKSMVLNAYMRKEKNVKNQQS